MPIQVTCTGCDKLLNAPDHAAGKKIRCPACQAVIAVPAAAAPEPAEEDTGVTDAPSKRPSSSGYSEKPREAEAGGAFNFTDDDGDGPTAKRKRFDDDEDEERRPAKRRRSEDDDDDYGDMRPRRHVEPHRGTTILVLGIISVLAACLCPLLAWILGGIATNMAGVDIPKMERGIMDREGQGTTTAGRVCAYIGITLGIINFIAGLALRFGGGIK